MNIFYTPDISGKSYTLNEQESKHCARVLRLTNGDIIYLVDGRGGFYKAEILSAAPKACSVQIIEEHQQFEKRDFFLHIAIGPTKNIDRTEWFLEKSTEIGIDKITPLLCRHSERKVVKTERLNKVITSAMKQSLKAYHPILDEMTPFARFIDQPFEGDKFIAHCEPGDKAPLKDLIVPGNKTLILIGPEGDFSKEEIELAKQAGFKEISLGEARLRTETAGVVACHTVNLLNQ